MRYGVFGGSFDPPTLGHSLACLWALETGEIDRILLIPVARHAFGKEPLATFAQRLEMCRLATARLGDAVEVSDIESHREGTSYMVDTLRILSEKKPDDQFRLMIGSDVAAEVHKWKESAEVLRLAPLLELPRLLPGENLKDRPGILPPISSTQAREALKNNGSAHLFVGSEVLRYLRHHQLYL